MSETVTLQLDIDNDLKFNEDNSVGLNIRSAAADGITINDDGLFVKAPTDQSSIGSVFEGQYDVPGLRVGANSPFGRSDNPAIEAPLMITCSHLVHRVFEAQDAEGKVLVDCRPEIDCPLPGDIYRVPIIEIDPGAGDDTVDLTDEDGNPITDENGGSLTTNAARNRIKSVAESLINFNKSDALGYVTDDDWCARLTYVILTKAGLSIPGDDPKDPKIKYPDNSYVTYLWNNLKSVGWYDINYKNGTEPGPGDVIIFDRDREGDPLYSTRPYDHIGVVTGYSDGVIYYVDGNKNGSYQVRDREVPGDENLEDVAIIGRLGANNK